MAAWALVLGFVVLAQAMPSNVVAGDEEYDINNMDAEQDYNNWATADSRPSQFRTQQVSVQQINVYLPWLYNSQITVTAVMSMKMKCSFA